MKKAINADTLEPETVRAAMQKLVTLRRELDAGRGEMLIAVLSQLTNKERQELLKNRFFRRLLGTGRKRGRRPPPPPM